MAIYKRGLCKFSRLVNESNFEKEMEEMFDNHGVPAPTIEWVGKEAKVTHSTNAPYGLVKAKKFMESMLRYKEFDGEYIPLEQILPTRQERVFVLGEI